MDVHYAAKPSMISETTWNRPNRYRSEAPLYYAAYGALQGSDAIVHFALDGTRWTVKPGFFMQPWSLMSPTLDDRPLDTSLKILLQVMSEEKPTAFHSEPVSPGVQRILHIGNDSWLVKEFQGVVRFKRPDDHRYIVTALDLNGYPIGSSRSAEYIQLQPSVPYYFISASDPAEAPAP